MPYASVHSRPGTAERNLEPITRALEPLVSETILGTSSSGSSTSSKSLKPHILELASGQFTHITSWANKWPEVEWWGSVRESEQLEEVQALNRPTNLHPPIQLDIQVQDHWRNLERLTKSEGIHFSGVVMLNLIHCTPPGAPEEIFKHLSMSSDGGELLEHGAWVAAYGPWLNDDGFYKSQADQDFERSHVQADEASLGLRSVASITSMAEKHGFVEERRVDMPAGNLFVVWRKNRES